MTDDETTTTISIGSTHRPPGTIKMEVPATFRSRFYDAKERSKERMGKGYLTNKEFLMLLLDVWEEYEEPRRGESEP